MSAKRKEPLRSISTQLITGFLGTGKTTLIRHLLGAKPAGEHWAVLINEFGAVGLDEQLLQGDVRTPGEIHISQVPVSVLDERATARQPGTDDSVQPTPPENLWVPLQPVFPPDGVISKSGQQEGYHSLGWLVHPGRLFDAERLLAWLKSLSLERIKAVVITTGGIVSVNGVAGKLQLGSVDEVTCSRLELLDDQALPEASLQEALLQCLHS